MPLVLTEQIGQSKILTDDSPETGSASSKLVSADEGLPKLSLLAASYGDNVKECDSKAALAVQACKQSHARLLELDGQALGLLWLIPKLFGICGMD